MDYPIADLLIRIKNGYQARKRTLVVTDSRMKRNLSEILVKNGYLKSVKTIDGKSKIKNLELELKYKKKSPVVSAIKIISKPGLRVYRKVGEIPRVKMGYGVTIVSTSAGLMIDREARKKKMGGEIICQIY